MPSPFGEGASFREVFFLELGSMRPLVISVHGIRTRGAWQKELTSELNRAGLNHLPLDYGFFLALQLLWPGSRQRALQWFLEAYTDARNEYGNAPISVIAHSFGSYLVARTLEQRPEVTFERVILCGSIVQRDYPWSSIILERKQVKEVLNDFGRLDFWAGTVGWLVEDAGPSGQQGFSDDAQQRVFQREHSEFRHSDYFYRLHYKDSWVPFLRGDGAGPVGALGARSTNWRFRTIATLAVSSVLLVLFVALSYMSAVRGPVTLPTQPLEEDDTAAAHAEARARSLHISCDGGNAADCVTLGVMYAQGRGLPESKIRAVALYQQACEQEHLAGCNNLASAYASGSGVRKDESRAAALYQRVCDAGGAVSCVNLASMYFIGAGVKKDTARAAALNEHACSANIDTGCYYLANQYRDGDGVPKDHLRALALYQDSCDRGDLDSCRNLGAMHEQGLGVERDLGKATRLYVRACDGGNQAACILLRAMQR
jgi:pimeloyl-ACP methyl ester carboxylesterase